MIEPGDLVSLFWLPKFISEGNQTYIAIARKPSELGDGFQILVFPLYEWFDERDLLKENA